MLWNFTCMSFLLSNPPKPHRVLVMLVLLASKVCAMSLPVVTSRNALAACA